MIRRQQWVSIAAGFVFAALLASTIGVSPSIAALTDHHTLIFEEDFDSGFGNWAPSAGIWEVGEPSSGPGSAYAGRSCAATNLAGNYAYASYSRLQSPVISMPAAPADGALWLRIWHYFNLSASDGSDQAQVQVYTDADGWAPIGEFYRYSANWTPWIADLSAYAGMDIRIGFLINDEDGGGYGHHEGPGWYVDEVAIFDGDFPPMRDPESFEDQFYMDWGGWYTSRGIWQIGEPSYGCTSAGGWVGKCAGTILDGSYPYATDSRLTSPIVSLPAAPLDGVLTLAFQQWCQFHYSDGLDLGRVQIFSGGEWITLREFSYYEANWSECTLDISDYAGQEVRFGFLMDDADGGGYGHNEGPGWFIDNVSVVEGRRYMENPVDCENFCPDWTTESGVWQIGTPTNGTTTTPSGTNCWGTYLDKNYAYRAWDELKTPWFDLPSAPEGDLLLRFWHYYSLSTSDGADMGKVRIHQEDGTITDLATITGNSGGTWSPYPDIDLSAYAGQRVRIGFLIDDVDGGGYGHSEGAGWYLDDIQIVGLPESSPQSPFLMSLDITSGPAAVNWYYNPPGIVRVIVYGSANEGALPSYGTRVAVLDPSVTYFEDEEHPGWTNLYYCATVVDANGHQSIPIFPTAVTGIEENPGPLPSIRMNGVSPNPFNPVTTIRFSTPAEGRAEVIVYDMAGRRVRTVASEVFTAGVHELKWDGRDDTGGAVASGMYFCVVNGVHGRASAKMTLLK